MGIVLAAAAGVLILAFAFREMFHDLFHPSEGGSLSGIISRGIFGILRRRPGSLSLAGPLATVVVIFSWAILLAIGFALIYWAAPPAAYQIDAGMAGPRHSPWTAFYFSLEVMTTLGLGDIKPRPDWLRVLVTLHTLIGLMLVTASLSWVLFIFPALSRVNILARTASLLAHAERQTQVPVLTCDSENLLAQLTTGVISIRVDLIHFPILYYFHAADEHACLSRSIGYIDRFARQGEEPHRPERIRFAATALARALEDYAEILACHLPGVDPHDRAAVFRAYAEHHAGKLAA